MVQKILQYKGILILILVLAGGYYVYSTFFSTPATTAPVSYGSEGSGAAQLEQELLSELLQLQRIQLDASVFSDPAIQALVDLSQGIEPQKIGRQNPFAPLKGGATTKSSDVFGVKKI